MRVNLLKGKILKHLEKFEKVEVDGCDAELLLNISEMVEKLIIGSENVDESTTIVEDLTFVCQPLPFCEQQPTSHIG